MLAEYIPIVNLKNKSFRRNRMYEEMHYGPFHMTIHACAAVRWIVMDGPAAPDQRAIRDAGFEQTVWLLGEVS
jgi:hypothetical protein